MIVCLVQQHQHQVEYHPYDGVVLVLVVVVIMKGWCKGAFRTSGRDRVLRLLLCISLHEVSTGQDIGNAPSLQEQTFQVTQVMRVMHLMQVMQIKLAHL